MWVPQGELLRAPAASSIDSIAAGFPRQKLWGLMFLALESWDMGPGVGLGLFAPKISLLDFYQPQVGEGPDCSVSVSLLPVWMDVVSSIL